MQDSVADLVAAKEDPRVNLPSCCLAACCRVTVTLPMRPTGNTGQCCTADLLSDLGMLRIQKICRPDTGLELALYSLDLE